MSESTHANDDRLGVLAVAALTASLLFTNLHSPYLWQDEAQTALLAETILDHGVPRGTDGLNFFSQEQGAEYGDDHVWRWHTWLSFYLVAGSFALLGAETAAARLPFAILGFATVLLTFATARALWRDRRAAYFAACGLGLCVPFLLSSRQARWTAAATFLSLLGLHAYAQLERRGRLPVLTLGIASFALFHTHYLYCASLLVTLLAHAAVFERARLGRVFAVAVSVTVLNLPWLHWLAGIELGESYSDRLTAATSSLFAARYYTTRFFEDLLPSWLLLIPLAVAVDRARLGEAVFALEPATRNNLILLAGYIAINIGALSTLSPGNYFRYLSPLAPAALLLIGLMVAALSERSRIAAIAVATLWIGLGPIRDYVHELTHDFDGPIEGIVEYLNENAQPGDVVAITYGDLPLKFYTDLRVVGGLTGEDLSEVRSARWIIPRHSVGSPEESRVRRVIDATLRAGRYRAIPIPYPDTQFENREDPRLHHYRTERPTYPRVMIYRAGR